MSGGSLMSLLERFVVAVDRLSAAVMIAAVAYDVDVQHRIAGRGQPAQPAPECVKDDVPQAAEACVVAEEQPAAELAEELAEQPAEEMSESEFRRRLHELIPAGLDQGFVRSLCVGVALELGVQSASCLSPAARPKFLAELEKRLEEVL